MSFTEDDAMFAARMKHPELGALLEEAAFGSVLRQVQRGDVIVFRFSHGTESQKKAFAKTVHQLHQSDVWRGVRFMILPDYVDLLGAIDGRKTD